MTHHRLRPSDRRIVLFTGVGFLFLWVDLAVGHGSAGLKHPGMWLPLLLLPFATVVSSFAAFRAVPFLHRLFRFVCYGAVLLGLIGFGFHTNRLVHEVKGLVQWGVLMRFMRYPPLLAPLAISGLGILGLLVDLEPGG